ncbi:MAG: PBP1A family penicillin-binding protein [Magnetococcales bacterium]|nr:PBP1A family penicillin-binding protein [Magnetococcales bacterium]
MSAIRTTSRVKPAQVKPPKKRGWFGRFLLLFFLAVLGGAGYGFVLYKHYSRDLPTLNSLADYHPSLVTRVYARDYQLLGEFYLERRQFVPTGEVPQQLIQAFLAIEDSRFYLHPGVDPVGFLRAMLANLKSGRVTQGASTITQQVAKTFFLSSERKFKRKIKEILLALRIEERFSKDEILELYVNQIYLGAGAYGVGAASRIYFDRDVSELDLGQMALLAGLPKAPSNLDPWRHPEAARARQKLVLNRMAELGMITAEQAREAGERSFGLARPQIPLEQVAPYFLEHVRRTIRAEWGVQQLQRGGLDVYTTLDPQLQRAAQAAVRRGLIEYDRRHGYRGSLAHLDKTDTAALNAWMNEERAKVQPRPDREQVGIYLKGVVTRINPNGTQAQVRLVDGQDVALAMEGMKWVRMRLKSEFKLPGNPIKRIQDALHVGDVVLLDPPAKDGEPYKLAQDPEAEGALVSLDPHTGEILAMVGGYDFQRSEFNRATQSQRQPGSSFKPFIYAAALEKGYTPVSIIDDSPMPLSYRDPETGELRVWNPENYERKFFGPTTLRVALEHSRNLVTIRLLKGLGLSEAVPMIARFGLVIPDVRWDLSIALGTVGFTPMKITSAYGVFANGGKLVPPVYISRVQDRYGRTVQRHSGGDCQLCHSEPGRDILAEAGDGKEHGSDGKEHSSMYGGRRLSRETSYQITSLLKGVITNGTGHQATVLKRPLAGKTGTTNDMRDAWFVGFSTSLVTGVWVGNDDNSTLGQRETGAHAALPIWIDFMRAALATRPATDFPVPSGIHLEAVDPSTGRPPSPDSGRVVMEAFKDGEGPLTSSYQTSPGGEESAPADFDRAYY